MAPGPGGGPLSGSGTNLQACDELDLLDGMTVAPAQW